MGHRIEFTANGVDIIMLIIYHHHVVLQARISLTLSRHFSLSFIASGRSSGPHPISPHSCWMYVRAGHPAFARPYVRVHRSTSLMSSSLLFQQCPACLVHIIYTRIETYLRNLFVLRWEYKPVIELYIEFSALNNKSTMNWKSFIFIPYTDTWL